MQSLLNSFLHLLHWTRELNLKGVRVILEFETEHDRFQAATVMTAEAWPGHPHLRMDVDRPVTEAEIMGVPVRFTSREVPYAPVRAYHRGYPHSCG